MSTGANIMFEAVDAACKGAEGVLGGYGIALAQFQREAEPHLDALRTARKGALTPLAEDHPANLAIIDFVDGFCVRNGITVPTDVNELKTNLSIMSY